MTCTSLSLLQNSARRGRLPRFARDESGGMAIFILFLILATILVGRTAVDIVRYESERARLQSMLDRATLAAANLDQDIDPETLVRDYAAKEGLEGEITNIEVISRLNSRTVRAEAEIVMNTIFMGGVGIPTLTAPASSAATEQIMGIEVLMVLDVSGSMNRQGKIDALQVAAIDFVNTLTEDDTEGRVSIRIVPFNGQVNVGPLLTPHFNITHASRRSDVLCVDLPASAYGAGPLSRTTELPSTGYVDLYTSRDSRSDSTSNNRPNSRNVWCQDDPNNHILLPTTNVAALHDRINSLRAVGATSINAGLRWGTALLDPDMRGVFTQLQTSGQMDADTAGRPYDIGTGNIMKVIVLMTDGSNFNEYRLRDGYRSGPSPFYAYSRWGRTYYTVHHDTGDNYEYYTPDVGWRRSPYGGSRAVQLDWRDVWEAMRMDYVAYQFYYRALGRDAYYAFRDAVRQRTDTSTMNAQLQTMCNAARNHRMMVFGVSFQAPEEGREQIYDCAFTPSHYYEASVSDVDEVFGSIANQIQALRLIQ